MIVATEMPLDDISVISALLHEITRHSNRYSLKNIATEFGQTVAEIVGTVQKIHHVENHNIYELDNYRRLLLSLFKDVRIILLKLADRLHNMRTLQYLDKEKQKKVATETLEIYAPFAHRFGLANIKWELEDQAFKVVHYDTYKKIRQAVQLSRKDREDYLRDFIKPIKERLNNDEFFKTQNIKYEITGRVKHLYSIYNKTILRNKPVEELYDLFAIRVILDTDNHHLCYIVLSIISDIYETMPATYKNYIASPKRNGYQSIHIAFFGKDKKPVEVQIRTRRMHEIAEKGLAAHFKYKPGMLPAQTVLESNNVEDWLDQIRSIFETIGDDKPDKLIESVRRTLLFDEIYVFTPANEFRVFPKDSTALDFAYGIHTEIGNHCIGAKVNGRIVPIDYKLQSGDVVEILTSESKTPSPDWLTFVITQKARNSIQKYLRDKRKALVESGKKIWRDALQKNEIRLSLKELRQVVNLFNFNNSEEFYISLSEGTFYIDQVLAAIRRVIEQRSEFEKPGEDTVFPKQIEINLPVKLAKCCYPLPGDKIFGEIIPGKEIIVHRRECNKILELISGKQNTIIRIDHSQINKDSYTSKLEIRTENKPGINSKITAAIVTLKGIRILGFKFNADKDEQTGILTISFKDINVFNQLLEKLKEIDDVKIIERYIE
jgi:RelA/SpoT family (p)ppGpp synthetase